jgi:hypothetical protein
MHPSLTRIAQLQSWRGRKTFEPSIARAVLSVADQAQRTQRRLGELADLWQELVPGEVAAQSALAGLRSGVLHVLADSAAAAFELDRLLRSGLEAELRTRYRGTLSRVRVRVGSLEHEQNASPRSDRASKPGSPTARKPKPSRPSTRRAPGGGRPRSRGR